MGKETSLHIHMSWNAHKNTYSYTERERISEGKQDVE
jgi:hypothetical protein